MNFFALQVCLVAISFCRTDSADGKRKERKHRRKDKYAEPLLNATVSPEKMEMIKKSWFTLVQEKPARAESLENEIDVQSKKEKRNSQKKPISDKLSIEGPRGPPGPQGPPGPSGATTTHDELLKEFRSIMKATGDSRANKFRYDEKVSFLAGTIPDVISAFVVELSQNLVVPKKTFAFLRGYHQGRPGSFIRGTGLDLETGRFVSPYTAVYRFEAALHVVRPIRSDRVKPHNAVTAMICINGDCHNNLSLKYRTGMVANSKAFTISVSGHLYLERNQFVEVVVENTASSKVTITPDSTFSGCLLGV